MFRVSLLKKRRALVAKHRRETESLKSKVAGLEARLRMMTETCAPKRVKKVVEEDVGEETTNSEDTRWDNVHVYPPPMEFMERVLDRTGVRKPAQRCNKDLKMGVMVLPHAGHNVILVSTNLFRLKKVGPVRERRLFVVDPEDAMVGDLVRAALTQVRVTMVLSKDGQTVREVHPSVEGFGMRVYVFSGPDPRDNAMFQRALKMDCDINYRLCRTQSAPPAGIL
jgi:hypothetical protein